MRKPSLSGESKKRLQEGSLLSALGAFSAWANSLFSCPWYIQKLPSYLFCHGRAVILSSPAITHEVALIILVYLFQIVVRIIPPAYIYKPFIYKNFMQSKSGNVYTRQRVPVYGGGWQASKPLAIWRHDYKGAIPPAILWAKTLSSHTPWKKKKSVPRQINIWKLEN